MEENRSRRKPIPPLIPATEPLSTEGGFADGIPRFTLQDHSTPVTPEPRRFALQDPSPDDEVAEMPSYPIMHRFTDEDRAVLSPISERPERQSSKASSATKSSGTGTIVGVPAGGVFGGVMQSVNSAYPTQPEWNQTVNVQQQYQQQPEYPSGYHGMFNCHVVRIVLFNYLFLTAFLFIVPLPAAPSFVTQPTGVSHHATGYSQPYQYTGTTQTYDHTGTAQIYQDTGAAQSYQNTGFTQSYQHTGASYPQQQQQSTGFSYQQPSVAGFETPIKQSATPTGYSTALYSSPSAVRSRTTPDRPNSAYALHASPAHAEAYGRYSRASYQTPRSRSASPQSFRGNDSMEYDMVPDATVLKFDQDVAQEEKKAGRTYVGYKQAKGLHFDARGGVEHVPQRDGAFDLSLGDMGNYGGDSDEDGGEIESLKHHYEDIAHPSETQHL